MKSKKKSLTPLQQDHLNRIISDFQSGIRTKYIKGALEHDGNLFDKACHQFMTDEIIDLFTYLHTHLEHIQRLKHLLQDALEIQTPAGMRKRVEQALSLLTLGREDGKAEPHKE